MSKKLGTDVGGTFTDFVVLDEQTGEIKVEKKLTTPDDPTRGNINGIDALIEKQGLNMKDLGIFVHGTTLVANALIERKGAKTGLITTEGFRDVLEIGNEGRYNLYDLFLELPKPIIPRSLRKTVRERIASDGKVLLELDEEEVLKVLEFFEKKNVESIAVSLFNAYANDKHEKRIKEIIQAQYPEVYVTLSSEVAPEIREYERTSTAVANAFVQPLVKRYVNKLHTEMQGKGLKGHTYIMLSSGGITTVEGAGEKPIEIVESGPAAGVIAAAYHGRVTGNKNLISFDMGGTTAKISIIENNEPHFSYNFEVARIKRFEKGSGLPLKIPVIEMIEIGAGGGSIAHIDSMGLLKVGPESAGADPGPVCYRRGGTKPTVTDADVVLGFLNPEHFLGGEMALDLEGAKEAIRKELANPTGMDIMEAAAGIHNVVNNNMGNAAKIHTAEMGKDPRQFSMIAFGGAGPVHAYGLAKLIHIKRIIYPVAAGVASALGLLVAPLRVDTARSYVSELNEIDWEHLIKLFEDMEAEAFDMLEEAGVPKERVVLNYLTEIRYAGQGHEVVVPITRDMVIKKDSDALREAFNKTYKTMFGRCLEDIKVEAMTWRISAVGPGARISLGNTQKDASSLENAYKGTRDVFFPNEKKIVKCNVYDRYFLPRDAKIEGPAIIEERESTIIFGSDAKARVDENHYIILDITYN